MRPTIWSVALLVGLGTEPVFGQGAFAPRADDIRHKIEQLQGQLQALETQGRDDRHTPRIGTTRVRRREALVVRLYDLSDLFASVPSYPALRNSELARFDERDERVFGDSSTPRAPTGTMGGMGGMGMGMMGGMGGGMFQVSDSATNTSGPRTSLADVIRAIKSTISPQTWSDAGGESSIAQIGTSLLISTDEETHTQIDELLNLFRKRWGTLRTVSVRAQWLWLNDAQLASLLVRDPQFDKAFGLVDPKAWEALQKELADPNSTLPLGYRAAITGYNGQTVSTNSGHQHLAITEFDAVAETPTGESYKGPPAYNPKVQRIQEGVAFEVTPMVTYSAKYVVLDVRSRVCHQVPPQHAAAGKEGSAALKPIDVANAIDRPRLAMQEFSTTVRLPVDRPMLVAGTTYRPRENYEEAEPDLYLFVTVSVQELRDEQRERTPATQAKPNDSDKGTESDDPDATPKQYEGEKAERE
jgi:hypothetical protein